MSSRKDSLQSPAHKNKRNANLPLPRQLQAPHHRQGQHEDEEIRYEIHGAVCEIRLRGDDAVAGGLGLPEFVDGRAAEELGQEVAEQVPEDEEHECPGGVAEARVHAEETEVEEEDGEFVAEEGDEVDG